MAEYCDISKKILSVDLNCESELSQNNVYKFDIFVIHDDDEWTSEQLLHLFDYNGVSYLSLENDSQPGKSKLENFEKLLNKSKKVLFVVSEELCQNEFCRYMVESVIQLPKDKILTLITTGNLRKNGLCPLETTNVFEMHNESLNRLITEIKADVLAPDFCTVISTGNTCSVLFLHGLCLQHFYADTYGLIISIRDKYLKVDIDEFSKHLDTHEKLKTDLVCGQCSYIRGIDTKVSVVINKYFPTYSSVSAVLDMFARLCWRVCDGSSIRTNWMVILSYDGPFDEAQQQIISTLYRVVFKGVAQETNKRVLELMPCFPKFDDFEKRLRSFPEDWSDSLPKVNAMAEAGFFFVGKPCRVQCFNCGLNITALQKMDDPINLHLRNTACPYKKSEPTKKEADELSCFEYPIQTYTSFASRLETYHDFENKVKPELNELSAISTDTDEVINNLAEAGFYYLGIGTLVTCYMCGLKLSYRDFSIDPWCAHAELSTNCRHLMEAKYDFRMLRQMKKRIAFKPTIITFQLYVENQKKNDDGIFFSFSKEVGDGRI